ncbi:MAG: alcohol dehydrogenase catalytic domain-containing protein [Rhodospirillales bacterium]|nr:alcohol dehydrogenase catalytic domain-containing protein [Rhodospirillales bacterium]
MKTRAAILRELGLPRPYADSKPIRIEEIDLAPPGEGEIMVRIAAAGLCHSDLSVINGSVPVPVPLVPGHEASGVITELGPGVTDFEIGDHVVMMFVASCGKCRFCVEGRPALCEPGRGANIKGSMLRGGTRISQNGEDINHMLGVSCFAEHAVVSRESVLRVDKDLPLAEAALFGCAVVTGVGAVLNTANMRAGSTVAVVGLGGVGLNALMAARLAGAARIIAIDLLDDKLDLASRLGATETHNAAAEGLVRNIFKATGGGVDYAFETAGAVKALELAFAITRTGGTTISAGLPDRDARMQLPAAVLMLGERTLKGSFMGSAVPARDIPAYIELYRQGRLPVDQLMSERIGLEDLNTAFDRLADGVSIRQVLVFD